MTSILWLRRGAAGLDAAQIGPTILNEDNAAVIFMVNDDTKAVTSRSKHIETRFWWLREQINENQTFEMAKVNTDDNIADLMTKSLSIQKFEKFADKLVVKIDQAVGQEPTESAHGQRYGHELGAFV